MEVWRITNSRDKGADGEEWRPVVGYEGFYEASSNGNIRSLPRNTTKGKVLKQHLNSRNGYLYVSLSKNNIQRTRRVHRLIAGAFWGDSPEMQVNHKNGVKTDNRLSNLEYCTQSDNMKHAYRTGLEKATWGKAVICLDDKKVYETITECAKAYGGNRASQITRVCNGERKHFRKKRFMYYDEYKKNKQQEERA